MATNSIISPTAKTRIIELCANRAKVVAPPQPRLARNLGHSPRECPTAQRQIRLNVSFFLYVNCM